MSKDGQSIKGIEDLINFVNSGEKIAETNEELLTPEEYEVRNFIRSNDITATETAIPQKLIYSHYRQWCKHDHPLSIEKLIHIFKQYFEPIRVAGNLCFKINPDGVGLHSTYSIYQDSRFNSKKKEPLIRFKGVIWNFYNFIARVDVGDQCHFIGYFKTQEEAAYAYDVALFKFYGKEAQFNFKENIDNYEAEAQKGYPSLSAAKVSSVERKVSSSE